MNLWKQGNTHEKENVTFICLEFSNANTTNIFLQHFLNKSIIMKLYTFLFFFFFLFFSWKWELGLYIILHYISDDVIMKKMSWFCEN
jgi:hypothetical protein